MKIAIIGLGKLGMSCALAIESKGHEVRGYDTNPEVANILNTKKLPCIEDGADELLKNTKISLHPPSELCEWADIVFIAVQTLHEPMYEGITPLPNTRKDFDYAFLVRAVKSAINAKILVVISTVLPGTIRREILPIRDVIYNPFFIAMGTTINDFLNPEFVLMGSEPPKSITVESYSSLHVLNAFYATIHRQELFNCSIEEAEIIKVSYNTYLTAKICIANTIMEVCHKVGNANCDNVTKALSLATERIISSKYMKGGMGDGGNCHPRDAIAMSWLSKNLNLSYDIYEKLLECRESQTKWLAEQCGDKVIILGKAFKKNTNITAGSCAVLITHFLKEWIPYDPHVSTDFHKPKSTGLYFIATEHDVFKDYDFPEGSVVIDPFRFIEPKPHFKLIRIGDSTWIH